MQTDTITAAQQELLYDYLVVINPDPKTAEEVKTFKEKIAETLGMFPSRYSKAHITLYRSVFPERFEDDFIFLLDEAARRQSAFTVYTSRFDHFRHGDVKRTLYVNVANPKPVVELRKRILHMLDLKPNDFKPHITVARGISTAAFDKVYPDFDGQLYVRSFGCHNFILLRKPVTGGMYEQVKEFSFGQEVHQENELFVYAA